MNRKNFLLLADTLEKHGGDYYDQTVLGFIAINKETGNPCGSAGCLMGWINGPLEAEECEFLGLEEDGSDGSETLFDSRWPIEWLGQYCTGEPKSKTITKFNPTHEQAIQILRAFANLDEIPIPDHY